MLDSSNISLNSSCICFRGLMHSGAIQLLLELQIKKEMHLQSVSEHEGAAVSGIQVFYPVSSYRLSLALLWLCLFPPCMDTGMKFHTLQISEDF